MKFSKDNTVNILQRTPEVISNLLTGLPMDWLQMNEGENTWSPYDILGHLIHGEKTDWMIRAKIILSDSENKTFESFDRFAQEKLSQDRPLQELLEEFKVLRNNNIQELQNLSITESDLDKKGIHPELGQVTLRQLLSTWTTHDLGHISQITRVMAKQYKNEVGPWSAYLGILRK